MTEKATIVGETTVNLGNTKRFSLVVHSQYRFLGQCLEHVTTFDIWEQYVITIYYNRFWNTFYCRKIFERNIILINQHGKAMTRRIFWIVEERVSRGSPSSLRTAALPSYVQLKIAWRKATGLYRILKTSWDWIKIYLDLVTKALSEKLPESDLEDG